MKYLPWVLISSLLMVEVPGCTLGLAGLQHRPKPKAPRSFYRTMAFRPGVLGIGTSWSCEL